MQSGWLSDRFGVVPSALGRLLCGPDGEARARVMQAMLKMVKFEVAALEAASRAESS